MKSRFLWSPLYSVSQFQNILALTLGTAPVLWIMGTAKTGGGTIIINQICDQYLANTVLLLCHDLPHPLFKLKLEFQGFTSFGLVSCHSCNYVLYLSFQYHIWLEVFFGVSQNCLNSITLTFIFMTGINWGLEGFSTALLLKVLSIHIQN